MVREDARQGLGRTLHGSGRRLARRRRVQAKFAEDARQLGAGVVSRCVEKKSLTKHPSLDARIAERRAAVGEEFKY